MKALARWIACLVVAGLALELFFLARIAAMAAIDPQSTTFQRSEMWRIALRDGGEATWRQQWAPYARISDNLKRAVIASEDAAFTDHMTNERRLLDALDPADVDQLEHLLRRWLAVFETPDEVGGREGDGHRPGAARGPRLAG